MLNHIIVNPCLQCFFGVTGSRVPKWKMWHNVEVGSEAVLGFQCGRVVEGAFPSWKDIGTRVPTMAEKGPNNN